MRVEVRRRPSPAGAAPTPKRSANASPGLVKAYSDSCFESSPTFYIASPDHPKLGQWAKPSTLKYSQPSQQIDPIATKCLDEALLFASSHSNNRSRSRTAGCSSRHVGRGGSHRTSRGRGSSATAAPPSSVTKASRPPVEPAGAQRPISPMGTMASSIQGQREAPRIDTPISGRVAPLHHRSFTTSTLPASPTLCGSFDQHHHPRISSAGADAGTRGASSPVAFDWVARAVDSRGGGEPPVLFDNMEGTSFGAKRTEFDGEERGALRLRHEEDQAAEPDVRYRVEKIDGFSVGGRNGTMEGGRPRQPEGHRSVTETDGQADPPLSTLTDGKAVPRAGGKGALAGESLGKEGGQTREVDEVVGDGLGVDPWVASQVDPFMSSLREALLRDRPADVPAYVSAFSADRQHQHQRQRQREKEAVL